MFRLRMTFAISSALLLAACAGQNQAGSAITPQSGGLAGSVTQRNAGRIRQAFGPNLVVKTFATGSTSLSKPDPTVLFNGYVYVAYQNASTPTGGGSSTIVEYAAGGTIVKTLTLPGRCDGMRLDPYTHDMWATVNEDANSSLYVFDASLANLRHYTFSSASHGGGYDDLAFLNGKAFVAASNPALTAKGRNTGPALVSVTLSGSVANVKPVLYGDSKATDKVSGGTIFLNLTDPDSLAVTPSNTLVVVSQGDSEIVYVSNPGTATQTVKRLQIGTQIDDIAWATESDGVIYVADSGANAIYQITGSLSSGTAYVEAPSDSGVAGFVGTLDETTGTITPVLTGFQSPTSLIFVADRD